jgi:hypothetical protein
MSGSQLLRSIFGIAKIHATGVWRAIQNALLLGHFDTNKADFGSPWYAKLSQIVDKPV